MQNKLHAPRFGRRTVVAGATLVGITVITVVACGGSDNGVAVTSGTVVQNVTVVDTRTGALNTGQAVVVDQGKITQILPSDKVRASAGVRLIDGSGKYVVPGYLDMHTHSLPQAVINNAPQWPMLIAHGITGIREMAGAPVLIAAKQQFNAARAAGTLNAPEVLQVPGAPVGGAVSAADGIAAVQQTKAMGGDYVKVVSGFPAALTAILTEARAQGLDVAGHISPGLSAVDSANAGWKSMEHQGAAWGITLDCAADQAAIRQALLTGQGARPPTPLPATYTVSPYRYSAGDAPFLQRLIDSYDATKCETVAQALVGKGTWQVPTLIRMRTMTNSDAAEFINDPNLKYVDPTTRLMWTQLAQEFSSLQPASAAATYRNLYPSFVNTLKLLRKNGGTAKIMTGTDIAGIWIIPGVSLHQEFQELAKAGFTPLEVLQATTINGARFLNRESTMGSVGINKNADLVLLDADPTLAVANLSKISGVFNAGKYFSKADLDAMKAGVATASAAAPLLDVKMVLDPTHRD